MPACLEIDDGVPVECVIPLPGGYAIGVRPIDQHLKGPACRGAGISIGRRP